MYHFTDEINTKAFFWFGKKLVEDTNWAMISSAAKAVYPVIASYANEKGIAYPGEETIAALAGVDHKTARKGIHALEGFPGFDWGWHTTRRGKRSKKFLLKLIQQPQRGEAFPFHRAILETGNWRELSPTGKALYVVMRYFAYFDIHEYEYAEGEPVEVNDFAEIYSQRDYDFCEAEKTLMARHAGIDRTSIPAALKSIKRCHLIEELKDREGWKIYLRDNGYMFKRDYLNENAMSKNSRS